MKVRLHQDNSADALNDARGVLDMALSCGDQRYKHLFDDIAKANLRGTEAGELQAHIRQLGRELDAEKQECYVYRRHSQSWSLEKFDYLRRLEASLDESEALQEKISEEQHAARCRHTIFDETMAELREEAASARAEMRPLHNELSDCRAQHARDEHAMRELHTECVAAGYKLTMMQRLARWRKMMMELGNGPLGFPEDIRDAIRIMQKGANLHMLEPARKPCCVCACTRKKASTVRVGG